MTNLLDVLPRIEKELKSQYPKSELYGIKPISGHESDHYLWIIMYKPNTLTGDKDEYIVHTYNDSYQGRSHGSYGLNKAEALKLFNDK